MSYKGTFLVVEGHDFSGKTTQLDHIENYFKEKNIDYVRTRSPGGDNVSEKIRDIVLHSDTDPLTDLLLFLAARIELSRTVIEPALREGKVVLCDRYDFSTIAYQVYGDGLVDEYRHISNALKNRYVVPDNYLVLITSEEVHNERKNKRGIENRLDELSKEKESLIRDVYLNLAFSEKATAVDADKDIGEVWSFIHNWLDTEFLPKHLNKQNKHIII